MLSFMVGLQFVLVTLIGYMYTVFHGWFAICFGVIYRLYSVPVALPGLFSSFVLFVVLLLCLVDPVRHCGHLVGEMGASCFDFLYFVTCLQSFKVGLPFLL